MPDHGEGRSLHSVSVGFRAGSLLFRLLQSLLQSDSIAHPGETPLLHTFPTLNLPASLRRVDTTGVRRCRRERENASQAALAPADGHARAAVLRRIVRHRCAGAGRRRLDADHPLTALPPAAIIETKQRTESLGLRIGRGVAVLHHCRIGLWELREIVAIGFRRSDALELQGEGGAASAWPPRSCHRRLRPSWTDRRRSRQGRSGRRRFAG